MLPAWFRKRSYGHFDMPVGQAFTANAMSPAFVAKHSFSPLIHFEKKIRRYKSKLKKVVWKIRPIMFASHRDACILDYYASILSDRLNASYERDGISEHVVAYRALGRANYHFAADALRFARDHKPCMVLAFDVTKFFDTLDHGRLKARLREILAVNELPADWFAVLKSVTRFRYVSLEEIHKHPDFAVRLKLKARRPIATMAELKAAGIEIVPNAERRGIPQGTPISSVLANLYLRPFDLEMAAYAREVGGFYRRYSDDILFICREGDAREAEDRIRRGLKQQLLEISEDKTERTSFDDGALKTAQYLGFDLHPSGASIRPGSLSRQWRNMRRAVRRAKANGDKAIASGKSKTIYMKALNRRFMCLPGRNFSSYARKSAEALQSRKVLRQARRLERKYESLVKELKVPALPPPGP